MADTKKLVQELEKLEDPDWFAVLHEAHAARRKRYEKNAGAYQEPKPGVSAEQFAQWIARRHLATDPRIREVIYLPMNSPGDEIRLLEVNATLDVPETDKAEYSDFSPDIEGIAYRVLAADITPKQWDFIQQGGALLPDGWSLDQYVRLGREKTK